MPLALVHGADAQRADRTTAERADRVDRVADRNAGEAPPGARAEIAGALRDDDDIGVQRVQGSEQARVHGDGFQIAAVRLSDGHRRGKGTVRAQPGDRPREPERQRAAVGHDVHDTRIRLLRMHACDHRRQRRVQISDHHRQATQVVGVTQHRMVC